MSNCHHKSFEQGCDCNPVKPKKCYIIWSEWAGQDEGIEAIVATNANEAKSFSDWSDPVARVNKKVKVDDLPIGEMDFKIALIRGAYGMIEEGMECEECTGEIYCCAAVNIYEGKFYCVNCLSTKSNLTDEQKQYVEENKDEED